MNNLGQKILKHYKWSYTLVMLSSLLNNNPSVELGMIIFIFLATLELVLKRIINKQLTKQDYRTWGIGIIALGVMWLVYRLIFPH